MLKNISWRKFVKKFYRLGFDGPYSFESYLLKIGFLHRTPGCRIITDEAKQWLGL